MSYSAIILHPLEIDRGRILDICGVIEQRIQGIYLYGSQVYGTNSHLSDFDILVVASSLHAHKEFRDGTYNVHIKTPDLFLDELWMHKMHALECIYAPRFAKLKDEVKYCDFVPVKHKLQREALSESHVAWTRGKRMILDGDMYRGMKSLWHSLRILLFALQIINEGDIYDFSEANNYWESIEESKHIKWNDFKDMLLPIKIMLMDMVKEA